MANKSLSGDVAFVTGAASGIGLAVTTELIKLGAKVIMVDINENVCSSLADRFNQEVGSIVAIPAKADTRVWEEQVAAYELGAKEFGRVDYFFANAGVAESSSGWIPNTSSSSSPPELAKPNLTTFDINITGNLYTSALALQVFERQEPNKHGFRGKLVLTASIYAYWTCATMPMYNASKAGVLMFMRSLARLCEMKGDGVTVNSVAPNLLATGIADKEALKNFEDRGLLDTRMELVVQQYMSVLGDSKDNGKALSICGEHVWDHPVEMTKWDVNKPHCDMMEFMGGVGRGYWETK